MSIAALFNLDPTQFALGRSTGRFRGIMGNPSQQNQAELGNLLKGIQTVTTERPGEFTAAAPVQPVFGAAPTQPNLPTAPTAPNVGAAPTVYNLDPSVKTSLDAALGIQKNAKAEYDKWQNLVNGLEGKNLTSLGEKTLAERRANRDKALAQLNDVNTQVANVQTEYNKLSTQAAESQAAYANWKANSEPLINKYNTDVASYKAAAEPLISKYISDVNAYNTDVKAKTDVYNTDVTAYNKILGEYKSKVDAYNTDVTRYQKEVEDTRNKFQKEYLSQNVNQELIPAEGEVLAASSLYSDTLHQEMLNKVAEANASEPSADRVTSLYSTGR